VSKIYPTKRLQTEGKIRQFGRGLIHHHYETSVTHWIDNWQTRSAGGVQALIAEGQTLKASTNKAWGW